MSDSSKSIDLYYEINVSPSHFNHDVCNAIVCSMHMFSNHNLHLHKIITLKANFQNFEFYKSSTVC